MNSTQTFQYEKLIEPSAKIISLIGICLYACGFIITNSYLSGFGFYDYNVLSPRFVFTGALYAFILMILWVGLGRKVIRYDQIFERIIDENDTKTGSVLSAINIMLRFFTSFAWCAIIVALFLFRDDGISISLFCLYVIPWIPAAIFMLFVDYGSNKILYRILEIIFRTIALVVFFAVLPKDSIIESLTWRFYAIFGIASGVREMLASRKYLYEFNSLPFVIITIFIAISGFGSGIYSQALQKYGGPIDRNVEIILKNKIDLESIGTDSIKLDTRLIYQTDKNSLCVTNGKSFILSNDEIRAIRYQPVPKYSLEEKISSLAKPLIFWKS